jgi:proline dehydrogenase
MSALDKLVLSSLPHVPRPVVWRVAKRYVAGETLASAIERLGELARRGHPGVIDVLGEEVNGEHAAREVVREYQTAADAVVAARLDAYVSVKPTHVGLRTSEQLALTLYGELARYCKSRGLFLRVEMEDHTTTDATLRIFEALRKEHDNVGIVLQSRLLRTPDDIARLAPGKLSVRMVKGIYLEPAEIAHTGADEIREAYVRCVRQLLARGAYVSLATHDRGLGASCIELVRSRGLSREAYEFQVLLGVLEPLWSEWHSGGHTVRVYVPFGPQWLPYSLRRLRKNPEMLRHVMRAALGLGAR